MKEYRGTSDGDRSVLDILRDGGVFLPADCGGRGTCGKCKVRFFSDPPAPTPKELQKLSTEALEEGFRLACETKVTGDFRVAFDTAEEEISAASVETEQDSSAVAEAAGDLPEGTETLLAVDIGTTTVAAALVGSGKVLRTETCINHQRSFGADVISRIQASNEGNGPELQRLAAEDIRALSERLGADLEKTPIIISGNTTMQHLLQGLSCQTLGVYPFTPVDISLHQEKNLTFLPGISTYVGADIVSGIVASGMDQNEEVCLLIDLGTNGEMAIGNRDRILVASTAAGPAFEGGNISCGVAGIPGAISGVDLIGRKPVLTTIGEKPPVGLCGSGVIEIVYELLKAELLDETGLLDDDYVDEGFPLAENILFTDKDVREVQLAKSAIRAGAETLMQEYGVEADKVQKLYLAGGFGQKINLQKAAGIGLLPESLLPRTEACGNTSLRGAVLFAGDETIRDRFLRAVEISTEVSLSESKLFQDLYMDCMMFGDE